LASACTILVGVVDSLRTSGTLDLLMLSGFAIKGGGGGPGGGGAPVLTLFPSSCTKVSKNKNIIVKETTYIFSILQ
jgi:hypothetical protein